MLAIFRGLQDPFKDKYMNSKRIINQATINTMVVKNKFILTILIINTRQMLFKMSIVTKTSHPPPQKKKKIN